MINNGIASKSSEPTAASRKDKIASELGRRCVYERIRSDIIEGRFQPGEHLKVADLAKATGTSTNPVREALQQLRGEGLVVIEQNYGARVRSLDEDFVRDIAELNMLMEPRFVERFLNVATPGNIDALDALLDQMIDMELSDTKYDDLNLRFHLSMYGGHYNRQAVSIWTNQFKLLQAMFRRFSVSVAARDKDLLHLRHLVRLLRASDLDAAKRRVAEHALSKGFEIVSRMRSQIDGHPAEAEFLGRNSARMSFKPGMKADAFVSEKC